MKKTNNQPVLMRDDYNLLLSYLRGSAGPTTFDRFNAEALSTELKKAKLVSREQFPPDVIRLNSTVEVRSDGKNDTMQLILVTPEKADIREKRISVLSPVGTALIGLRRGQSVKWDVPSGKRTFTVVDVIND
jgi:regulator of nucleoside diphosphate kinase